MIPKIIHYCWFGRGEKPKLVQKCIRSWKKYCPDYEIIEWNEDNFDVNSVLWTKQAYEVKKYAFVADYVRLMALNEHGGVYLDSDVELVKPLDAFAEHDAYSGFERANTVPTGIIASVAGQPVIKRWLDYYTDRPYLIDGKPNMDPNVSFMTADLKQHGLLMNDSLQNIDGMVIYPQTYFCPLHTDNVSHCKSKDTVAIHYFTSSWRSETARKSMKRRKFHSTFIYRIYEQIAAYPIALYKKVFKR